jgi:DNA-binding MarR family transcriptional regulator
LPDRFGDEFQAAFWATKRAMADAAEAAFRRHGIRAGQQFILQCLWEEDCLSPGVVARRLNLATPTVTRAATRMEAAGLLARRSHPTDERGLALREVVDEEMRRLTERALATLTPGERAQLVRYLTEIRRSLARAPGSVSGGSGWP